MAAPLLSVDDLHVQFRTRDGVVRAVNGVSFSLERGETVALLGESGSGKSVTAQAIMGLLDPTVASVTRGSIRFQDRELVGLSAKEYRQLRGSQVSMVFQDALSALNPVISVGSQVAEMFRVHAGASRGVARRQAIEVMERVGIQGAATRYDDYPHQFSGGMRQRVMIAMAIAMRPALVIADEPTTALDVTVQAQIMDLLEELQRETGMGMILITHDLGVVASVAQQIVVMYAGRVMERGAVTEIYSTPANPYTRDLLDAVPRLDARIGRMPAIPGMPPSLLRLPAGCAYHPRCRRAGDPCATQVPPLAALDGEHVSACWFSAEVMAGER